MVLKEEKGRGLEWEGGEDFKITPGGLLTVSKRVAQGELNEYINNKIEGRVRIKQTAAVEVFLKKKV